MTSLHARQLLHARRFAVETLVGVTMVTLGLAAIEGAPGMLETFLVPAALTLIALVVEPGGVRRAAADGSALLPLATRRSVR